MDVEAVPTRLDERIATAQERLDGHGLIRMLQEVVRIPSVYDRDARAGSESGVVDVLERLLGSWGMSPVRYDVAPHRPNLIVDLPGTRPGPILILEGHTDVVTVGDAAAWTVTPFGGEIRDGNLYGRGACDMKGGLMAMLFAARALKEAGSSFAGTLRLAILADEEGMMLGAKAFVADGYLEGARAAIICEPEGDRVCIAQKGAMRLRVTLVGRMAHGAMPDQGINPIPAMAEIIRSCQRLEREIQEESPPHPLLGRFHLTPTVAIAGEREQGNVIPASAELILDVRTTEEHDHATIRDRIAAVIDAAARRVDGVDVQMIVLDDRPATTTDPEEPIVCAVVTAHQAETGKRPPFGGVPGSTDGTIFWAATRIPLVTYGPGSTTLPHQADEYVGVDDVVRYSRTYISAVLRYFDMMEQE